ncbi:cupin domain-containing protein [Hymenobacter cellulosilyticus]|uniref:Cupin domain-containing protein n=1 Tax=Hymenobacter cellulosilyticus TaxID=2932248 RepID=A0A8T9Q3H2_9BACT|nr:cupin domain-containing protein [Hymenobacter cellulosilyticus]UOQ71595.1 cupin domain-containing protein [Hymenobacter cellulosilyticus]
MKKHLLSGTLTLAVVAACLASAPARAQTQPLPTGIRRVALQRHDLATPGREAVQTRIEFDPGAAFGRHNHPGEELIYVLEGELQYQVDGQPPVTLKAGEVLFIPAGTVHAARNVGKVKASELATYLVEKGKPILTLVKD